MNTVPKSGTIAATPSAGTAASRRLFGKYVALFLAVAVLALVPSGILAVWFSYQEQKDLLFRIQREQAVAAAEKIGQFVTEIQNQLGWTTQLPIQTKSIDEMRFDAVRLLRQAPAVAEIAQLDGNGRERYRASRQAADVVGSMIDFSKDPAFVEAMAKKIYYGPVYFVQGSEPYMEIAEAGLRPEDGVVIAKVNLTFIWDVVSRIKVGKQGLAYVVDSRGQLIAHPDISLVLRKTDLSQLSHVAAARALGLAQSSDHAIVATDLNGNKVLSAYARVTPLGWLVFTELPIQEAYAPLYATLMRSGLLSLAALTLAVFCGLFLARTMVGPIRALNAGAARIGSGDLAHRIAIDTGDELEDLGQQFNRMAERLQDLYATLERKVEERTHQLEIANQAKSRFLATASHDLRQPLHALGLFVGQLHGRMSATERKRVVGRIEAALSAMNELFNALLDISKLDAGALTPNITDFALERVIKRVESTFAGPARQKGLIFRVMSSSAWVRSDFILLERILLNLASNAVRYTSRGRVLVGCRRQGDRIRIEVRDTGPGIAIEDRQAIFGEFYRLSDPDEDGKTGFGLGLAIVDRLCRLLDHPISLESTMGKGSCFSISVPIAQPLQHAPLRTPGVCSSEVPGGKFVVIIDDDPLVLDGMKGLLQRWGCHVVTAATAGVALDRLTECGRIPDVIVSDYHLPCGTKGIEAIASLRKSFATNIPAFLISGDTDPEQVRQATGYGLHLLHKPVDPMALRAVFAHILAAEDLIAVGGSAGSASLELDS
jgi:signal transduction histidine kinase/CheY-like chemotaxis protein